MGNHNLDFSASLFLFQQKSLFRNTAFGETNFTDTYNTEQPDSFLEEVIKENSSSINSKDLDFYNNIRQQFEEPQKQTRNRIDFR